MKSKKSTNPLILTLIILLGLMAGYFFYSNSLKDNQQDLSEPLTVEELDFLKFGEQVSNYPILDSRTYNSLRIYGEIPVSLGVSGRTNPFLPF